MISSQIHQFWRELAPYSSPRAKPAPWKFQMSQLCQHWILYCGNQPVFYFFKVFTQIFRKFLEARHVVAQLYGVPHGILQVFIILLYENVFQNPELFPTQVSLSPKQSTLVIALGSAKKTVQCSFEHLFIIFMSFHMHCTYCDFRHLFEHSFIHSSYLSLIFIIGSD
jgi:hypothetical protein